MLGHQQMTTKSGTSKNRNSAFAAIKMAFVSVQKGKNTRSSTIKEVILISTYRQKSIYKLEFR